MDLIGNTTRIRASRSSDRIGLTIAALLGCAGCGGKAPALVNPGVSTAVAENAPLAHEVRDAATVWERAGEIKGYRTLSKEPFVSQGHFDGRWVASVLANDLAATEYAKLPAAASFPPGAVVVQAHTERAGGAPGPIFAMVKRDPGFFPAGGDWEYVVTLSDGHLEDRGQLAQCARCHADGTSGWLFGLAPSAR